MTTLTMVKALFEFLAVVAVCYGFYREKDLIKFEQKAYKFVKCFFKALKITLAEKHSEKKPKAEITHINVDEVEVMTEELSKKAAVIDIKIA